MALFINYFSLFKGQDISQTTCLRFGNFFVWQFFDCMVMYNWYGIISQNIQFATFKRNNCCCSPTDTSQNKDFGPINFSQSANSFTNVAIYRQEPPI